ncbi:MAG: hypothetical protein KGZ32_05370 [Dethiobacter sp.]|nr:hypothetical protein [Dethiobacter sp.]
MRALRALDSEKAQLPPTSENLNDDRLGRALENLEHRSEEIETNLALRVLLEFGLCSSRTGL